MDIVVHYSPQIFLIVAGVILLVLGVFVKSNRLIWFLTVLSLFVALILNLGLYLGYWVADPSVFKNIVTKNMIYMTKNDGFALFFNTLFIGIAIVVMFLSEDYLNRVELPKNEYYNMVIWATVGLMFIAASYDLVVMFIGLEILSISLYVMVGLNRKSFKSKEASFKYFLLGAFSSAFLLYGIALLYGVYGSTNLLDIVKNLNVANVLKHITTNQETLSKGLMLILGGAFTLIGFAFKVSLVPFHMWTPDVYEGAPSPVTGYMATAPKAGGIAAILKIVFITFLAGGEALTKAFGILAIVTLITGNLIAIVQTNIKRMLAFSSITHIGYVFLTLYVKTPEAAKAVMFYITIYAIMNIGAFAVISHIAKYDEEYATLDGIKGLAYKNPYIAMFLAIFMFSLAGIPPTAGFVGKFYLFSALVKERAYGLAVYGVLNSVLALYYYLNVVAHIYMKGEESPKGYSPLSWYVNLGFLVSAFFVLFFGVYPGGLMTIVGDIITKLTVGM